MDKQIDKQMDKQMDEQMDEQMDKKEEEEMDRQENKSVGKRDHLNCTRQKIDIEALVFFLCIKMIDNIYIKCYTNIKLTLIIF